MLTRGMWSHQCKHTSAAVTDLCAWPWCRFLDSAELPETAALQLGTRHGTSFRPRHPRDTEDHQIQAAKCLWGVPVHSGLGDVHTDFWQHFPVCWASGICTPSLSVSSSWSLSCGFANPLLACLDDLAFVGLKTKGRSLISTWTYDVSNVR